jgi:acyl-CoA reductase-like NAD-dependent aldehyde dehydrogenase
MTVGGEAQLPFDGTKSTGVGEREMAEEGLNFFTELKPVYINDAGAATDGAARLRLQPGRQPEEARTITHKCGLTGTGGPDLGDPHSGFRQSGFGKDLSAEARGDYQITKHVMTAKA